MKISINAVLAYCTLFYYQWFLQKTLELVLISFTTNTWIMIKKLVLNMIISTKQQFYKLINGKYKKKALKKEHITFSMTWLILKTLIQAY